MLPRVPNTTFIVENGQLFIRGYSQLPEETRHAIRTVLAEHGLHAAFAPAEPDTLVVPQTVVRGTSRKNLAPVLSRLLRPVSRKTLVLEQASRKAVPRHYPVRLDFDDVRRRAILLADTIAARHEDVVTTLLRYETHEVATDEIGRTLDLLRSLHENAACFQRQVGPVPSFLPSNQPLYSLACFGVIECLHPDNGPCDNR